MQIRILHYLHFFKFVDFTLLCYILLCKYCILLYYIYRYIYYSILKSNTVYVNMLAKTSVISEYNIFMLTQRVIYNIS